MATKVQETNAASSTIDPARLYLYEEIATVAGATPRQVRRWVEEGRLGYVQLPKGRRVAGQQYLDFIAGRTVAPDDGLA